MVFIASLIELNANLPGNEKWHTNTESIHQENFPHAGAISRCYAGWIVKQRVGAQSFNLYLIDLRRNVSSCFLTFLLGKSGKPANPIRGFIRKPDVKTNVLVINAT